MVLLNVCFKSLAYCCSLEKKCERRDNAMQEIGLSEKDYEKLKNKFDKELVKVLNKRK